MKFNLVLIVSLLLLAHHGNAQKNLSALEEEKTTKMSDSSEFIEGKVTLSFVVEKDGSISHIKILESTDPSLNVKAKKALESMPKKEPAHSDYSGKAIRSKYKIDIIFKNNQESPSSK